MQVQHGDSLMSGTTSNPLPLAIVDAVIPRARNLERVKSDLGFELKQRQPVRLIIPAAKHTGELEATPQEKDKSMHAKK